MTVAQDLTKLDSVYALERGIETGGAAARRYHADYGSRLPFIDRGAPMAAPKSYPDADVLTLPYPPRTRTGFRADFPAGMGDLLALTYGLTRIDWTSDGIRPGRPLPSGGGAYPGELYAVTEFGLCHYLPTAHALERLTRRDLRQQIPACLVEPPEFEPELVLILTSRHGANAAGFGRFGVRLQALDTGFLVGQALTLLDAACAPSQVHSRFDDASLADLLGLDPDEECVRAVITAGAGLQALPVPAFSTDPGADLAALPRTVMARHSMKGGFEPVSVPLQRIREILDSAARTIPGDLPAPAGAELGPAALYCLANRVDGLEAGCHRRRPEIGELSRVLTTTPPNQLFATGTAGELAGFQAAGALMIAGDYEHGYAAYGDRWYRMLNMHAGILGQRIGLAAAAAGLGASVRCDYRIGVADRLIDAWPGLTVLLVVLVGLEHGVGAPGHRLLIAHGS